MKLLHEVEAKADQLEDRIADETLKDGKKILVKEDAMIDAKTAKLIEKVHGKKGALIKVRPFVSEQVEYISPEYDEKYIIETLKKGLEPLLEDADYETLYDTSEEMTVKYNDGQSTIDLYNSEYELIFKNGE